MKLNCIGFREKAMLSVINSEKMDKNKINDFSKWYIDRRPLYKNLSNKVESVLTEILRENKITIHNVYSRTKDIDSFLKKIDKKNYDNPENEIHDFAGIRIITYVESEINKIIEIVRNIFEIDEQNSVDKRKELGIDRVGYKSVHFVAQLKDDRLQLPEYKKFKGLKFEIQIRTILQHAWAEIEHDRNYKFAGQLPEEIKRRFTVLSGTLELADREFDSIAKTIDDISNEVEKATKSGKLEIPINSTTLRPYLKDKLQNLIEDNLIEDNIPKQKELEFIDMFSKFDIYKLSQLEKLITPKFIEFYKKNVPNELSNFHLFITNLLLATYKEQFYEKVEKEEYNVIYPFEIKLLEDMKVNDIDKIIKKFDIEIKD